METGIREPCVAGQFYPADPGKLRRTISQMMLESKKKMKAKGALVPHAGYYYSGGVASHVYSTVDFPDLIAIIGPNHTGYGKTVGVSSEDFKTPLGVVKSDQEIVGKIVEKGIPEDNLSHKFEHSIEVQLPFLQFVKKDFKIVAITMMDQRLETSLKLGEILNGTLPENSMVIASSDMSHYVPREIALHKDKFVIDEIKKLDPEGLYHAVTTKNISMCGYGCAIAMLNFAILRKSKKAKLLKYATSGDVEPMPKAVGYCAMVVY